MIAAMLPTDWIAPWSSPWLLAPTARLLSAEIEGWTKPCSAPTMMAR
jgi:hypothetical protein